MRMGDTVQVCVTTFKGRHKIQSRWENKEYVVEQQPYLNLPVYLVCPIDGKGHCCTLHMNYLLPINSNLEQGKCENSVGGDGNSNTPTPMPCENGMLPVDGPTKGQLESMPNSSSKQHELYNPGLTSIDSTDEGLKADNDTPVPLIQSSRMMRNQPPWRYWNFTLQQNYILPSAFNIWVGLCICLHIISCVHIAFVGNTM